MMIHINIFTNMPGVEPMLLIRLMICTDTQSGVWFTLTEINSYRRKHANNNLRYSGLALIIVYIMFDIYWIILYKGVCHNLIVQSLIIIGSTRIVIVLGQSYPSLLFEPLYVSFSTASPRRVQLGPSANKEILLYWYLLWRL